MKLSKKYSEIQSSLKGVNQEMAQLILDVLDGSGSSILKSEHLRSGSYKFSLEKILTLSKTMREGIDVFIKNVSRIGTSDKMANGSQYYIVDFGGSKTQYTEILKSKINELSERDERPFTEVIPVKFRGSLDLTATYLGESIESDTARLLASQLDLIKRDPHEQVDPLAFDNFMNLLLDFRKAKNAPEHLENIHAHLSELERLSGNEEGVKLKIAKIRSALTQLPFIDEERLLNIVFNIMEYASRYKITYIFLFDECDDWLAKIKEDSIWTNIFRKRQYFFRKLYDRIINLRLYQIYCLTPRVHEILRGEWSDFYPGVQRISNDLVKTRSSGHLVELREQGVYLKEEAIEATLKWLVILEKTYHKPDNIIFETFLPKLIEKIDNKLSRRKANSAIISAIRSFIRLTEDIKNGQQQYDLAKRTPKQYIVIGDCIESAFSSYLNYLNFNFKKKHQNVGNNKLIDGQFIITPRGRELKIYAEFKSFGEPKNFKIQKIEQVINCVKNLKTDVIFFLFCPGLTEDFVWEKLHEWKNYGLIESEIDINKITLFTINDQTLLNCLVGFKQVQSSRLSEKFEHFDKLLRLLNKDFHGKLFNLFPPPKDPEEKEIEEKITQPLEEIYSKQSYVSLLQQLKSFNDTNIRTSVEILINFRNKKTNKIFAFRKNDVIKDKIDNLLKNSFNDGVNLLKQFNIIVEKNEKIRFNWDKFETDKNDVENFMIDVFSTFLNAISN